MLHLGSSVFSSLNTQIYCKSIHVAGGDRKAQLRLLFVLDHNGPTQRPALHLWRLHTAASKCRNSAASSADIYNNTLINTARKTLESLEWKTDYLGPRIFLKLYTQSNQTFTGSIYNAIEMNTLIPSITPAILFILILRLRVDFLRRHCLWLYHSIPRRRRGGRRGLAQPFRQGIFRLSGTLGRQPPGEIRFTAIIIWYGGSLCRGIWR